MDWTQAIELSIAAAGAGILGSMLGLGGGVFMVPIFTLFLGVDAKLANEKFVANAPEEIVEEEKEKREAAVARKTKLQEALERLKKAS